MFRIGSVPNPNESGRPGEKNGVWFSGKYSGNLRTNIFVIGSLLSWGAFVLIVWSLY